MGDYSRAAGKCVAKYAATRAKLQAKASGSGATCDNPRLVDNGDGTVTDRLTGLQWEKKTNLDSAPNPFDPHDADNTYTWNATGAPADGTTFTDFPTTLNSGRFAGQCDWRLPTRDELLTIASPGYPACITATEPRIDPVFGPTVAFNYWSATTLAAYPGDAWNVSFAPGSVYIGGSTAANNVRAVRSGS